MTDHEVESVKWLLTHCDRDERRRIADMAMSSLIDTYPEVIRPTLTATWVFFSERLAELD